MQFNIYVATPHSYMPMGGLSAPRCGMRCGAVLEKFQLATAMPRGIRYLCSADTDICPVAPGFFKPLNRLYICTYFPRCGSYIAAGRWSGVVGSLAISRAPENRVTD